MSLALEGSRSLELDAPSVERALGEALAEASRARGTAVVSLPAPVRPSEALLAGTDAPALAWAAPWGFELAALGEAAVLKASGPERFRELARSGAELLASTRPLGLLGAQPIPPRLFGGFSFQPGAPRAAHWAPFGEARFVLPELAYVVEGGRGTLVVTATADRLAARGERDALVGRALDALATLERGLAPPPHVKRAPAAVHERPADEWTRLVEAIGEEIARGALEKVVLARRVAIDLHETPDPAHVLARLRLEAPECTRFLVRQKGSTFLGATPERLAKKRGAALETEAVAGSMSALDDQGARRLLESTKDLAEHALVVREILRALEPLATRIEHSAQPELHQLRHVLHLRTQVRATLNGAPHLLHVVERLHPTPAVGGVPTARALEWISTHEPDERGWYAGPIGWFDAAGDGEMAVALRSGVLAERTAHLYVGAGIVKHSLPHAELAETRWKLAALLSALGVSGPG